MDILVLGNGFDLAHGLPTKYIDFLKWIEVIKEIFDTRNLNIINWHDINDKIKQMINANTGNIRDNLFSQQRQLENLMEDNFWVDYFLFRKDVLEKNHKENWIDFESEISNVIKGFEEDITNFDDLASNELTNPILNLKFIEETFESGEYKYKTFREIRDIILADLEKMVRLLEIYLCEYVEKIEINEMSLDIEVLKSKFSENPSEEGIILSKVICFNYTHIFEKIYFPSNDISNYVNHIHGEAIADSTVESNNMVLGIDEYLKRQDRNKRIEFIGFKKYFQRIYKGTGSEHQEWIDRIRKDDIEYLSKYQSAKRQYEKSFSKHDSDSARKHLEEIEKSRIKHHVYFFGHSLDVTDKDIIKDLILHETVHTTIFYYAEYENDKRDLYQKIANLVKIIGQKKLISKTGGSNKTIEFLVQKDMIPIKK